MKVLVVHNTYQQRGGEDTVVEAEVALLRQNSHDVATYGRDNHELEDMGHAEAALGTFWCHQTTEDMKQLFVTNRPDVMHVHNTFPLISPSLYWAASRASVPVVQTLHNFRLLCPQAMLLRDGKICELCVGKTPLAGIRYSCYRGSRPQSAVVGGMLMLHRGLGTWTRKVARFIALNEFCRQKFIDGGLPADRIVVKPNFVDFAAPPATQRNGFLFVGRLSPEKGVRVLAQAAIQVGALDLALAGTGPEENAIADVPGVRLLGALTADRVRDQMHRALALVLPSIWYENFPRALVEAFASGLPVIASRIGALAELIDDGGTGLLFEPGNHKDLATKMRWALANPDAMAEMGRNARARYEANFTGRDNYAQLIRIYQHAIAESAATRT